MEIISRKAASDVGMARYFTGAPCSRGHLTERYVSSGNCVKCAADDSRKYSRGLRKSLLGWQPLKVMVPPEIYSDVKKTVEAMIAAHTIIHPPGVKARPSDGR
jgi:hypothetical protein